MTFQALVLRTLRLALPCYLATLVLALIPTGVMLLGLQELAGDRPWRTDLLGPGWMNLATEIMMEASYGRGLPGLAPILIGALALAPLAMLTQLVVNGFLAGGILEQLLPDRPDRRGFWAGCRYWFWPYVRVSLFGGVALMLVLILVGLLDVLARGLLPIEVGLTLQAVVAAIGLGWMELGRALMVRNDARSAARALLRAGRLAVQPLVPLVWLLCAVPTVTLLLAAMIPPAVSDPSATESLLAALAYGQGVAFVGAWTRVIRLVVATRLAQPAASTAAGTADHQPSERAP
jgi:hypothetical protein